MKNTEYAITAWSGGPYSLRGNKLGVLAAALLVIAALLLSTTAPAWAEANSTVVRSTLKNGLRVVIVQNRLAPVVTTEINYLVGSNEAPEGFPGMAHAQEHMMFRGSPGLSAAQLSTLIAAMGGNFDADTQQVVTQYFFTVPAEDLDIALNIEAIRMKGVLDSQKLWKQERGAIEQEVAQNLSNPEYLFYTRLLGKIFAGTPYAQDALGTRRSFNRTTGAMLKKFYDSWYAPNNAILVIVGDVDPDRSLELVRKLFGDIPGRPLPPRPEVNLQPLKPDSFTIETNLSYGLSVVAYRLPGFDSPDFAAGQILVDVLGSQRGNLYGLVPEGKALAANFSWSPLPKAALGYAMAAFPRGGDGSALVETIKSIVADYVKNGVPADLVEAAKRREIAEMEFQKNSVSGLADVWSQALAVEGRTSPEDDINAMKKVTVDDVNRVAGKYLVNDTVITAVLLPRASGKPIPTKGLRGKESFSVKNVKPVKLPAWAKKTVRTPALPAVNINPADIRLPNGLRLIVKRETISPTISIYGQVKCNPDLQIPKGKEGVDQVLNALFSYGTTTLDRIAFQTAVDDIGADISVGATFSLKVLSEHFDRGAQLLADNLLHPALPESAFTIVRQETSGALAGLLQSPDYLAKRALIAALYPQGDPSLRQATPATVGPLTLADVKDYYHKTFRPDLTTVVVIGNVTPEQAKAVIGKYFGDWTASGPKPETDLPPVPLNKPSSSVVPDSSRVQDAVVLAETLGLTRAHPDYYALQVGNHVLSGAFYATRLYRDLREQAGLVYAVESFLDVRKTRALFGVFYASDPPDVSKARVMVEQELRNLQTTPLSDYELQRTKALLLRQIPLGESSTDNIAVKLLALAHEDLPLDEPVRAAQRYLEMTALQVKAAFARWIRPDSLVQITQGPGPK